MSIIRHLLSRAKNWFSADRKLWKVVLCSLLLSFILPLIMILLLVIAMLGFWLYSKLFL
jgi:hypothetical protein